MRRVPAITLALALAAVASYGTSAATQYERAAVDAGALWRLITCQWTHWSIDHLTWDVFAFVGLGAACERRGRWAFAATVASAAIAVPLAVHVACPGITTFRGLSGVGSALFGLLLAGLFVDARRARSTPWQLVAIAGAAAFAGKSAWEHVAGDALFATPDVAWRVVPLSHAAGFACGVGVACYRGGRGWAAPVRCGGTRVHGGTARVRGRPARVQRDAAREQNDAAREQNRSARGQNGSARGQDRSARGRRMAGRGRGVAARIGCTVGQIGAGAVDLVRRSRPGSAHGPSAGLRD